MLLRRLAFVAGFVFIFALIVGNTLILRRQLAVLIGNQERLTRSRQIRLELENAELLLKDAETGERGYLYTGDPKYLATYNLAVAGIEPAIDGLAQLTADNSHQQARIPALRALSHAKLAEFGQTISLYSSNRRDQAKALVESNTGLIAMNNIHNLVAQMDQEEAAIEVSRTAALQKSNRLTIAVLYLTAALKALFVGVLAIFILWEINRREKFLDQVQRREEWYSVTLDSIGDAVICTDAEGNISFINHVAERLTGWPGAEATGRPMEEVLRIVDATTRTTHDTPIEKAIKIKKDWTEPLPASCILTQRDGRAIFIEDSAAALHDREGKITGTVLVFRDVTEKRVLQERLAHAAEHDPLTGLPNRALLNDRVTQAIVLARRQKGQAAVLFMDLDGFKNVNDSLGHPIGDKVLQSVARRLLDCVRAPDTVSRQGGDEFIVLLQELKRPEDASATAARLLKMVADVHCIGNHRIYITGSLGVSVYPGDGQDAETLIKNADAAMYLAKKNGRRGYQFFKPEMNVIADAHQSLEQGLRHALERNEITLQYQPKIDLKTGAVIGAEALSRWTHPTLGSVPPVQFIPIAEESGLILPIGAWVLNEACKQAKAWADAGMPPRTVAVNISEVQLRSADFLEGLFNILGATGLDPSCLELDVSESVLAKEPARTASILKTLRNWGVEVSVDNFGTGDCNLRSLQKLALGALKIDRSFVRGIAKRGDEMAMVRAMIGMGQRLNLRVIAEGVETIEALEFLWANNCDEAQGYYFGEPGPPEKMVSRLQVH
jgi:diguanylate cyclase (GGDEF)-like protein/PAS domain S-box-containing protein